MKRSPSKTHRENAERVIGSCGHLIPGWPSIFTKTTWSEFMSDAFLCDECEDWVPAIARTAVPGQVELPFGE